MKWEVKDSEGLCRYKKSADCAALFLISFFATSLDYLNNLKR